MPRIILSVHGFADMSGKYTLDTFTPYFKAGGFLTDDFDYGFHLWLRNDHWTKQLSKKCAELARHHSIIGVAHSNGCVLTQKALKNGVAFDQLVWIAPALEADCTIGPNVNKIHVLYSPYDVPGWMANMFPWNNWGSMGVLGYTGKDSRVKNYNRTRDFEKASVMHLDMFRESAREVWANQILELIK